MCCIYFLRSYSFFEKLVTIISQRNLGTLVKENHPQISK